MKNSNEYLMLREEMMWRLKSVESLSTFTYTIFLTIIGIALSNKIIELFIIPYLILIPISFKVANHKLLVGKLVIYLLKLERSKKSCFKWETYQSEYKSRKVIRNKIIFLGSNFDYVFMCLLSIFLFWMQYFRLNIKLPTYQIYIYIIVQALSTFIVLFVTLSCISMRKIKQQIIKNSLNI